MTVRENLLGKSDPAPVEIVNPKGGAPVVLVCEHAGQGVPRHLDNLGLIPEEMERHIAWDIGAAAVARRLSAALDACLVLQPYSRLVIDCNRPREATDAIPEASDGTPIPANAGLTDAARLARWREIHAPFHTALSTQLTARRSANARPVTLITVHSFTPQLDGVSRPWSFGLLRRYDRGFSDTLMAALCERYPNENMAFNEPYAIDDSTDYTIPVQAEARGLANVLIEIRNDLIADAEGQNRRAEMLATAIRSVL